VVVDAFNAFAPAETGITQSDLDRILWPPKIFCEAAYWWGTNFDPLLLKNPSWFQTAID